MKDTCYRVKMTGCRVKQKRFSSRRVKIKVPKGREKGFFRVGSKKQGG